CAREAMASGWFDVW
nr:immunoglobulin heavy chain junction region [Macaca mulatta]MPN69573.1 immunoglobulin heavy chain junction region [Macaca mulatta]MPN69692.1 immunoglobulin heavy chain junction region [Macaca mulatta]MPN70473.1 immunoglobulin heavy chain junction region [Macaca mulatta]MPN70623.1 immunoglobulin heavy chain junction region [Macaca mulatta]